MTQKTDFRALCAELLSRLEESDDYILKEEGTIALAARARTALAEPVGEAVGPTDEELRELRYYGFTTSTGHGERVDEIGFARAVLARWGHQPAPLAEVDCPACEGVPKPGNQPCAVCGRPAPVPAEGEVAELDDNGNEWQWYTYCPEEGIELYSDRHQAQSAAQSIMGSYEVAAHSDGWHEDMESVSWGMLVPVEQAQVVERKTAEPGDEFDEWVKYELRPARYGHQPAPPAEGEVAELVAWLRGANWDGKRQSLATRAAELLEQRQAAPVPVAVNDRLPGPEDCDAERRCWWFCLECPGEHSYWILAKEVYCEPTYWLPAHALPLPQGEVEHG